MDTITTMVQIVNEFAWGPVMLVFLVGTGLYLTVKLRFSTLRRIPEAFRLLFKKDESNQGDGDVSSFNALMTAMAATVGTGNIAGVATAVFLGGPGAMFWMWVVALFGMATTYSEAALAVHFREKDSNGEYIGGPMFYIKNGLGKNWKWMGALFSVLAGLASFGVGNAVQSNSIAQALNATFGLPEWITGVVLMVLVGLILLGGVQRIAQVAGKLVPLMALAYIAAGITVILMNATAVPAAFGEIFHYAFHPTAATGGFAGAAVMTAIRFGCARGVFSNEAGLGSTPIAHASAQTNDPVKQGTIAMLGTFIATLVICTMTGLVIIMSGAWTLGVNGAALSSAAFSSLLPGGEYVVSIGLTLFAFTTILGWSFYGVRCAQYLFGTKAVMPFRILWTLVVPVGALASLDFVWLVADTMNALMAIPNLVALLLLSPVVYKLTKERLWKDDKPGLGVSVEGLAD